MVARKDKKKNTAGHTVPGDEERTNKAIEKAVAKAEKLAHRYRSETERMTDKIAVSKPAKEGRARESQLRVGARKEQIGPTTLKFPTLAGLTKGSSRRSLVSTAVGAGGLILCCTPLGALSLISGLFAFILGLRELNPKGSSETSLKSKGFAIAGIVSGLLSIIGALAWLMFFLYWAQSDFSSLFLQ